MKEQDTSKLTITWASNWMVNEVLASLVVFIKLNAHRSDKSALMSTLEQENASKSIPLQ